MAYRLKCSEPLSEAVPRIVIEQIDRIRTGMVETGDPMTAVHEARKCLKRIRALLKLVRPGIDPAVYVFEASRYRTIAGVLSETRDRDIMAATINALNKVARTDEAAAIQVIKSKLLAPTGSMAARPGSGEIDFMLREAQAAVASLVVEGDADTIQRGLRLAYRKGRRLQRQAYVDGGDEAFHDLRKAVQLHWRHMQMLQKAWPNLFSARIEVARTLSQMLGDVQDIAVVIEAIKARDDLPDDAASTVVGIARASQRKARKMAPALGDQLFAQTSRDFSKSTVAIWAAAGQFE